MSIETAFTISSGSLFQSLVTLTENKWRRGKHVACGLKILKQWPLVTEDDWKVRCMLDLVNPRRHLCIEWFACSRVSRWSDFFLQSSKRWFSKVHLVDPLQKVGPVRFMWMILSLFPHALFSENCAESWIINVKKLSPSFPLRCFAKMVLRVELSMLKIALK